MYPSIGRPSTGQARSAQVQRCGEGGREPGRGLPALADAGVAGLLRERRLRAATLSSPRAPPSGEILSGGRAER